MDAYMCSVCGYLYDEETAETSIEGRPLPFQELPDDWVCPVCGVAMDLFQEVESDRTPDVSE